MLWINAGSQAASSPIVRTPSWFSRSLARLPTYRSVFAGKDHTRCLKFSREKTEQKISEYYKSLGLGVVSGKRAGKLSGGWQRRLSIAMALISEPEVLFLDEPTLGLDVIARGELWDIIRSLKGKITVILTTHYMEEAELLSDRVGIMKDGVLLKVGTPEELKRGTGAERFEDAFITIIKGEQK